MGNKERAEALKQHAEAIRNHPNADRDAIAAGFDLIADTLADMGAKNAPVPAKVATKGKAK